jgi:hypothetical protein
MRSPGGPLLVIVGAKIGVTLLTDNRYGYHRDELYYAVAARHLAFGYVDFPPLTPVMARLAQAAFGTSLVGLRTPALATGVAVVLVTAAMAKQLGGSPRAQWLAALTVTTCAFFLGANGLLQTVSFDTLAWALALYAFVRIVNSRGAAWWLALGGVLPENTMISLDIDKARDDFSAELGWPTVVSSIAHAYREVPESERSLVLTQNYSQASAVNLFGGRFGLPRVLSGHNTCWLWLPPRASIDTVVAVGFTTAQLRQ